MRGEEYIQRVVQELGDCNDSRIKPGMSFLAALEMMAEVSAPLKEEALVRLVVLGMERSAKSSRQQRACA